METISSEAVSEERNVQRPALTGVGLSDPKQEVLLKKCRLCRTEKAIDQFSICRTAGTKDGLQSYCKECFADLKRYQRYGVCKVKFAEMLVKQKGACAICGSKFSNSRYHKLSIDHDHKTGKVRELLCQMCNLAISNMKENPIRLRAAATYLERHGSNSDMV